MPGDDERAGRVAWVTGAASGIGAATVSRLAGDGARVACLDLDENGLARVVAEVERAGGTAVPLRVDVTDPEAVARASAAIEVTLGPVDTVVAAAGVEQPRDLVVDLPVDVWRRVLDVNVTGAFLTVQTAIPQLRRTTAPASVVLVSSVGGERGSAGYAAYVAAKHGVIGLMRSLAVELAVDGIRVNAVAPGAVDTPMLRRQAAELGLDPGEAGHGWAEEHLLPRLVAPEEVAEAIAWLASSSAAMTTGAVVPVDGGYLAR